MSEKLLLVSELARELGVTQRTLRFYEDKGLLLPQRLGAIRAYTHRDKVRMILILRGKRMGFSLREIKEFLDFYDADHSSPKQMLHLLKKVRGRIGLLEEQLLAVQTSLSELRKMEQVSAEVLRVKGPAAA